MVLLVWLLSMLLTVFLASYKQRTVVGWFFLSLFLGPIALFLLILSEAKAPCHQGAAVDPSLASLSSIKAEFEYLKEEMRILNQRFHHLEEKIGLGEAADLQSTAKEFQAAEPKPPAPEQVAQHPEPVTAGQKEAIQAQGRQADIEMNLGKFWLNKAGIVIFSLGVAFLLTYTFAHFGAAMKVVFGYAIAAVLFILGIKMEARERYVNYGRVLLGGAWAITYFTTYGMYHFEASKIINSQALDVLLLAVVAFGIICHSLRYRSEALTAVALFIGYITSLLGDVGQFTLISTGILAVVALVMVYKMQWVKTIFLGIILTYLTHFVWVIKQIVLSRVPVSHLNVENVYFFFDAGFLSIYWGLFAAAIHLIKNKQAEFSYRQLAAANVANFLLFFFMVYPKFYAFYPAQKCNMVVGFGLVYAGLAAIMETLKRDDLSISDTIIAVSLLTLAIPLKFLPYHTSVIWFIELPFLLCAGFVFQRKIYRYLGCALALLLCIKFAFADWRLWQQLHIFSIVMSWKEFLSLFGFISSAACFGLYRFYQDKLETFAADNVLKNFYSLLCVMYFVIYLSEAVKPLWLTFGLSLGSLAFFILGVVLLEKYLRWYALAVLVLAGARFCFVDRYSQASELKQLLLVYGPVACAFLEYALYRKLHKGSIRLGAETNIAKLLFFTAASLLVFSIVVYVQQRWITLSLFLVALSALLWGAKILDKYIRFYGLLILFFAAVRFLTVDSYQGISALYKWLFIVAKLIFAYGAYFIYRSLNKKSQLDAGERKLTSPLFYGSSFLMVLTIFQHIKAIWVSVALGIVGVFLFVLGFLIKDKVFRHGGFIIFAITLARVVFVDLSGLAIIYKIISFIILGILFLGVSFIYTKYTIEKPKQEG